MTRNQARYRDLVYTGISERYWKRDEIKARKKEFMKEYGCKAYLVDEDGFVSVWAEPKFEVLRDLEDAKRALDNVPRRMEYLKKEHEREIEALENEAEVYKVRLKEAEARLKEGEKTGSFSRKKPEKTG